MLKGVNINDIVMWDISEADKRTIQDVYNVAATEYDKVYLKEKTSKSGRFVNIYVYDNHLYRTQLLESIKVG